VELLGIASTGRAFITSAAFSSDGTLAALGTITGTVAIIPVERFAGGPVAVARQGRGLTAAGGVPSMSFHPSIPATNDSIAAVSPVHPVVAIADGTAEHGTIALWDLSTPVMPARISVADTNRVSALAWSQDGQLLAAGYLGGTACLWRRDG
jgi:WD40 repeat protein